MLPRRLSTITQLPEAERLTVLAEGAELLAESVMVLDEDAETLGASQRHRGAAVLRGFAEEEAAKVVILLDLARSGWREHAVVSAGLSGFYSHLARGLYVHAYDGSPADLAEVRRYVDQLRQEYYLDGPMDVDWIFGNEVLTSREQRLYVDYVEDEQGDRRWIGPAEREAVFDTPFSYPMRASTVVRLVAAMRHIGLLTPDGFVATRRVWDGVVVEDSMHWSEQQLLNVAVVERLIEGGHTSDTEAYREAVDYVLEHWIFPLTSLDLKIAKVDIADLERKRERWLAREVGVDYGPYI